jgi:hypothetical protein
VVVDLAATSGARPAAMASSSAMAQGGGEARAERGEAGGRDGERPYSTLIRRP